VLYKKYTPEEYPKYDNYDAINVDKTKNIPKDYTGDIGVPITFLDKYNPEQFEIIKFRKGNDEKDLRINGKCPYFRIIIRNKNPIS
jgi:Adenine-specific methyltransferase EcoRI